ncbi:MAG: glycosyltransferase family 9 protein [candidate division KSB1 bacterium]|nr:glycosyltransferase family 9 protein [candidate division KSB1 bacterium]
MKHLLGIRDWREIDLQVRLQVPSEIIEYWRNEIPQDGIKIFYNWMSSDSQRTLSYDYFKAIKAAFPEATYYTSHRGEAILGEIFPGGPFNLSPKERFLVDLFGILSQMDIVITANTGVAHAAAALGKPTIVIFTGVLNGWEGYWPQLYPYLYPTMHPIGLKEDLQIDLNSLPRTIQQHIEAILAAA